MSAAWMPHPVMCNNGSAICSLLYCHVIRHLNILFIFRSDRNG